MRGRRHRWVAVATAIMTAGCADMVGIGPLDVDAPPETTTSPTTPPPPAPTTPQHDSRGPTHARSEVDPSVTTCTEKETPFASPRIVFSTGLGSGWDTTNAIKTQDDVSARATPDLSTNDTQMLVALGFGFAVPANAIIRAVTMEIRVRQSFGPANGMRDKLVGLVPFEGAANLRMDAPYSDAFMTRVYRGDAKRWGAKLTPEMVDAPEFGVVFQSARTVYPFVTSVDVDALKMKIAYCE